MIVLFALSVFLFFVTLIEGDSLWFSMHCFVLGVFGSLSIVWAIFLVYIASGMAAGRKGPAFGARCVKLAVALLFAAMFIYVFFEGKDYHFKGAENKYGEILSACYEEAGRGNGIGLNGAVTGAFLGKLFGLSGAKVITVLSIIVYIMLATRAKTDFVYNAVNWLKEHLGILFENTKKWIADYKIKSAKRKEQRIALEAARREEEEKERIRAEEEAAQKAEQAAQKAEKEAERSKRKFVDLNNVPEAPMPVKPAADSGFAQMLDEIADDDEDYEDDDEDVPPPVENDRMRGDAAYMRLKEALGFEDDYHTVKQQNKGFSRLSLFEPMAEIEIAPDENDEDNISTIEPIAEDELVPPEDVMHEENADFYRFPPISLLNEPKGGVSNGITAEIEENGAKLVETLKSFGVATEIINISKGPAVTRYELKPMAGVKISRITGLSDDIALNLAAKSIRIEAPIPGKPAVGIEIPNKGVDVVPLREIIDTNEFTVAKSKTTVALGRDIGGQPAFADISKMPHLLIAGSTGSGKSVCINTIIVSILYKASPDEVKLLM
ncbi:MAG: DNA translocase FtsK, partial [Clostridia bacterium]|nr:DNA translocase FtsK [Clostridia bacterium]